MIKTPISFLFFLTLFLTTACFRKYKKKSFLQTNRKLGNYLQMKREYSSTKIIFNKTIFNLNNFSNILYAYYKDKKLTLIQNNNSNTNLVAFGNYTKSRYINGWDIFKSETYSTASPIIQCYSVGIIEGILSQQEIYYYMNNFNCFFKENKKKSLKNFFKIIDEKIRTKIGANENEINDNNYNITQLSYMACIHAQLMGIFEGYKLIAPENDNKDLYDFYLLNSGGNFDYILEYLKMNNEFSYINSEDEFFKEENLKLFYNTSKIEEIWKKLTRKSHCSAIVKLIKNNIFVGHNTWSNFNELLRTYKKISYAFEGKNQIIGMKPFNMHFSSYPGLIFSSDEYYIIGKNLAIVQTSLNILNGYIYKNLIDLEKYIPEFMRIMIVNMLSNNGKQWAENYYLINKNNHIYSANFIVIDYNNINSTENLMYIVEDIPGSVKYTDYTTQLNTKGYYGSFNLPFFKNDHGKKSGLLKFKGYDFYGDIKYNSRQYICDNLAPNVKNMKDFEKLLTYNSYKIKSSLLNDPSYDDPNEGIAVRSSDYGTIDYKIVDKNLILEESSLIYSGPIFRKNDESGVFMPFKKNNNSKKQETCRMGYPSIFNFDAFYFK